MMGGAGGPTKTLLSHLLAALTHVTGRSYELRDPIVRILSRMHKPGHSHTFISFEQASAALRTTIPRLDNSHPHEFFGGSSALNNWYVRSLLGPSVYRLPFGMIHAVHLSAAADLLKAFELVVLHRVQLRPKKGMCGIIEDMINK